MEKDLHKVFQNLDTVCSDKMSQDIWSKIKIKEKNAYKLRIFSYSFVGLASISGSLLSINSLIGEFSKLGFSDYFSLIFSDSGILATYWREYMLTLIESMPFISLALSLLLIFIFFLSVWRIVTMVRVKLLII